MAGTPKEDQRFPDIQHKWNYHHPETDINSASASSIMREQSLMSSQNNALTDNNLYHNTNSYNSDVYMNNSSYTIQTGDTTANKTENISYNVPNMSHQGYGNAMLSLDSGHLLRVFYDKSNQQLIFPNNQYELFNNNPGLCDVQLPSYTLISNNNLNLQSSASTVQNDVHNQDPQTNVSTSNILKEVLENLEPKPNPNGSYSPFGQNYFLNHPDISNINTLNDPSEGQTPIKQENLSKRNDNTPFADTTNKKRIVAEVKPMRPSYSDVLSKNAKNPQSESHNKLKQHNVEQKPNTKGISNAEKSNIHTKQMANENKHKNDKKQTNTMSSGSESGEINIDEICKNQKQTKKGKKKYSASLNWSSIDDITNEDVNQSQFVFIEDQFDIPMKNGKMGNGTHVNSDDETKDNIIYEYKESESNLSSNQNENNKSKKKKDKNCSKTAKPIQDKKKTQSKWKKTKPGYVGVVQNHLEHWTGVTWKAIIWFFYLLSDVCRMSAHLSFDVCASVFTQTYVSFQAVWRSTKEWLYKIKDNKYLLYIDGKLGPTRFGFWRKFKWQKVEPEIENGNESSKSNANIPLPATGEEAMKRLLACKGKDPYSILGVSVTCTDEEIKRYYRRQAFLVHPDKNQQPGAEEAFKILQHAFDLIGEPERREAYDRRTLESRHVEAAWSELSQLLTQLHEKMQYAANTIRCTNCGRRHKRVLTDRPCYAARYCAQCKIRHSAKEGDIWAESSMMGLLVMYYACMDGAVYQITQWASCQKKNLKQLRPDCHNVQYRIVLGNKAAAAADVTNRSSNGHLPTLDEFLNNLYSKSGGPASAPTSTTGPKPPPADTTDLKKRRNKKPKA